MSLAKSQSLINTPSICKSGWPPQRSLQTECAGPTERTCQVAAAKSAVAAKSDAEEGPRRVWGATSRSSADLKAVQWRARKPPSSEHYVIISLFLMFRYVLR